MAFEQFLSETYARPAKARALGYAASVAVHGPPLALFALAYLTHALVIGASSGTPTLPRRPTVLRIPIAFLDGVPAGGGGGGGDAKAEGAAPAAPRKGGEGLLAGRGKRRPTQPSQAPIAENEAPIETHTEYAFEGRSFEEEAPATDDGDGGLDGLGYGLAGVAEGESGAGDGAGADDAGGGRGGPGGPGEARDGALALAQAAKDKEKARAKGAGGGAGSGSGTGTGSGDGQLGVVEIPGPPGGPRMVKAAYVSEQMGRYLRTYQVFPKLPEWAWEGKLLYPVVLEVCVSTEGTVSQVKFTQKANADIQTVVGDAVRTWLYRPRVVSGSAQPFCHPIKIEYSRELRFR